jgi:hypothetical protein
MADRRSLLAVALLSLLFHVACIAQTILPAQDGLKFIRVAREFQTQPWGDVVRGTDIHPLYPAAIAAIEPTFSAVLGGGPDTWRISAQAVAVIASLVLLVPVYFLTEALFGSSVALLAAGIAAFLPRAAEVGHDTLSISVALCTMLFSLWLGVVALRRASSRFAAASGVLAGIGYLARPEVMIVPPVILLSWFVLLTKRRGRLAPPRLPAVVVLLASSLVVLGAYSSIKGEVSERISVHRMFGLGPQRLIHRSVPQRVPEGLDDPRWDFSPKEETDHIPIKGWRHGSVRITGKWWEELCWFFAVMTVWGLVRQKQVRSFGLEPADLEAREITQVVLLVFTGSYLVVLIRHGALLGYVSGRHVMALVMASIPWAAGGTALCGLSLARNFGWSPAVGVKVRNVIFAGALVASLVVQTRPTHLNHLSRWGHWSAGRWLAANAAETDLVLDTRGWARFISDHGGYDYWHVRQALTDSHLRYVVVGLDELEAKSPRAATLNALLEYAATPLVDFPAFPGDTHPAVRLYRFHRPANWEGLVP